MNFGNWNVTPAIKIAILFTWGSLSLGSELPSPGLISVVPKPAKMERLGGTFNMTRSTVLLVDPGDAAAKQVGRHLAEQVSRATGFALPVLERSQAARRTTSITLTTTGCDLSLGGEGYQVDVLPGRIQVCAPDPKGLFYASQTLRQLLPELIESPLKITGNADWSIPCMKIRDAPRFSWRGLMLDVSRTFMSKNLVKRYIDLMGFYKLNRLHWHLTDDQGWRIEIRKYPELTRVGSKYAEKFNEMGGYYTQAEIREVVAYAADRKVLVIPEIELPGHSLAALASYPNLSCTGGPVSIHPFLQGVNIHEEVFCAGNEKVYEFLQDVLTEVVELFPSPFIHIGEDEVPKSRWKACPKCQARIKSEGLKDESALQGYLVGRMNRFLQNKGRRLIGWDDILDGTVTSDVAVMYWTREGGLVPIVRAGHDVVLSPTDPLYFDYTYEVNSTRRVYAFEPVPEDLSPAEVSHILGAQANFWSHLVRNEDGTDRQIFPRLLALAEVLWSPASLRSWEEFTVRLEEQKKRLDLMGVRWMRELQDSSRSR